MPVCCMMDEIVAIPKSPTSSAALCNLKRDRYLNESKDPVRSPRVLIPRDSQLILKPASSFKPRLVLIQRRSGGFRDPLRYPRPGRFRKTDGANQHTGKQRLVSVCTVRSRYRVAGNTVENFVTRKSRTRSIDLLFVPPSLPVCHCPQQLCFVTGKSLLPSVVPPDSATVTKPRIPVAKARCRTKAPLLA